MKKDVIFLFLILSLIITAETITRADSINESLEGELITSKPQNLSIFVIPYLPILKLISPENKTYSTNSILLNYSAKDADTVWYNIDNGMYITLTSHVYFIVQKGSHILYLYAKNKQGSSSKNVTFSVSSELPTEEIPRSIPGGGGITKKDFIIDKEKIKISLKIGETKKEQITINNTGSQKLSIILENPLLKDFMKISEESFNLSVGESKTITLEFSSRENAIPDLYIGKLIVKADRIEKEVLIVVELKSKEFLLDVKVKIPDEYLYIEAGKDIKANITVYVLEKLGKVDVDLEYLIKNDEGTTIVNEQETRSVEKKAVFIKTFKIPSNVEDGAYILFVRVIYRDDRASSSDWFSVGKLEKPFLRKEYIIWIIIIIYLIILLFMLYVLKRSRKEMVAHMRIDENILIKEKLIKIPVVRHKELTELIKHVRKNI